MIVHLFPNFCEVVKEIFFETAVQRTSVEKWTGYVIITIIIIIMWYNKGLIKQIVSS